MNIINQIKKNIHYIVCIVCAIWGVLDLYWSESKEDIWFSIVLLSIGVLGICIYVIDRKKNKVVERKSKITIIEQRSKIIALLIACLVFVGLGYSVLPFNHLFDGSALGYTPAVGYTAGIVAILFFGYGFVVSIKRLIKPRIIMQISDKGLYIAEEVKKQTFIEWKDVIDISKSDLIFFIHYKRPQSKNKQESKTVNVKIAIALIKHYDIEQIESIIVNKINEHSFSINQ